MSPRRVLITGAGGFVGQALARGFADLGWQVIGLDRSFDPGSALARAAGDVAGAAARDVRIVTADLDEGVPADVGPADLVVHAAWVTTDPETLGCPRAAYVGLNLRPLLAALEYAARARTAAFVFLSSSGVFAPGDGSGGLTDSDRPTGSSAYAVAKRAAEALVPAALEGGTATHVARLGYLLGPGEVARSSRPVLSPVARWAAAARRGEPVTVRSDDPVRDWTLTTDLAAALERIADGPPAGRPVHVASPYTYADGALAGLVASALGARPPVTAPAADPVKPPMVPSDIAALRGFGWTEPSAALRAILAEDVAA